MFSSQQSLSSPDTSWVHTILGDQNFQEQTGFFAWWYRHTSLPDPGSGATFEQRNRVRKSRTAAALILFLATILVFVALLAYFGPNKQIITVVYTLYPILAVCVVLNRTGHIHVVGILLSLGLVGGMSFTLLMTAIHGGISPNDKDILYLLFFDELFTAALLPVNTVFLAAALNILLSIYIVQLAPHTPVFAAQLPTTSFSILFRVMQINVIVPLVLWVLEKKSIAAIQRADQAEELLRLQHDVATMEAEKARDKALLEQSIAQISKTHALIANGHLEARVPRDGTILWQIAGPLNTLLERYQGLRQEVQHRETLVHIFERLMDQSPELRSAVTRSLERQRPQQRVSHHLSPRPPLR